MGTDIALAETREDIAATWPVMRQLRPHLDAQAYLELVVRLQAERHFKLARMAVDGHVVAAAGLRFGEWLHGGRYLEIEDFVTSEESRSLGHGGAFFDWIAALARGLTRDVVALWIAARDPRTPLMAKLVAGAVAAYALSPIDLIPDFIPILGYLDDLLLVPAGIWLAVRLVPRALLAEFRAAAEQGDRPRSFVGAVVIVALWLAACGAAVWAWLALSRG